MLIPVKKFISTSLVSMLVLASISTGGLVLTADSVSANGTKEKGPKMKSRGVVSGELKNSYAAKVSESGESYPRASAESDIGIFAGYGFAQVALDEAQLAYDSYAGGFYPYVPYNFIDVSGFDCADPIGALSNGECGSVSVYENNLTLLQGTLDNAAIDTGLAFAQIGSDAFSDPVQADIDNLLGFGEFNSPLIVNREVTDNDAGELEISNVSLTF